MNSNTLFRIFGYFVLSVCVLRVRAVDLGTPSVAPIGKLDRGIGAPTGVRGAIKPISSIPGIPTVVEFDNGKPVVADDPAIVTAELAKDAAKAQAKIAETQGKNAAAAKKVAEEKAELAKKGIVDVQSAATKAQKASGEAKLAKTAAEALSKAEEATKEAAVAVEKAKIIEAAAKSAQEKATEAEKAYKTATKAADIAKVRAEKAEELDKVAKQPTAKAAKVQAAAAEKSATAAKASSITAAEFASAANDVKTLADKLVKEAEGHKLDASAAAKAKQAQEKPVGKDAEVIPPVPEAVISPEPEVAVAAVASPAASVPEPKVAEAAAAAAKETTTPENEKLPDKAKKAEMNYVKDGKYDYQAQLLKEDRCSEDDIKKAKCKKNSNCYLDHTKPVCICFPGYSSEDATKTDCSIVDKPTCKNEANTCHRNANCKESKTLGIGCQCKDNFSGDGLLCSSAFSYFMNFFLLLAVVSVQLYL